jgi:glutamyl-tRNA synthetase
MADRPVRVRFAPSPTGSFHIGGARTALFNWMFARAHGGKFLLRIEDTDQGRSVKTSLQEHMDGLRWLGLQWDEGPEVGGDKGPYIQSERLELYQKWAHWLVEQGKAYKCYATEDELKRAREIAEKRGDGKIAGYERIYRFISATERARIEAERSDYVIRLAMPLEGEVVVHDAARGKISFPTEDLSDIVLLKSDGFPTYHLAMAVDDHFMEISHVMRAEEWLSSFPMHKVIYDAFGWEPPIFVHLPIMTYQGKKLSKRNPPQTPDGRLLPIFVREFKEQGYLPQAVINWLANIGWSFGNDQEIFSIEEAIPRFSLEKISIPPTETPFSKLDHFNGHYIRQLSLADFIAAIRPFLEAAYGKLDEDRLAMIAPHLQIRVNPLTQAVEMAHFLFVDPFVPPRREDLIGKGMDADTTCRVLQKAYDILNGLPDFAAATQEAAIRGLVEELGMKAGQVFNPIRWATTNQKASPPLFESMEALGKATTLARIQAAIALL